MTGGARVGLFVLGFFFLCANRWGTRIERLRTWLFELLGAACMIVAVIGHIP